MDTKNGNDGCINFKDQALIKRRQANKKMNAKSGKFKDEKRITIKSCFRLLPKIVNIFKVPEFTKA
jgi:hypothetical protein